ncbi:MAG: hypothetical protein ACI9BN_001515, partial [Francisella sp.]
NGNIRFHKMYTYLADRSILYFCLGTCQSLDLGYLYGIILLNNLRLSIVYLMTWTLARDLKHLSKETTPVIRAF